METLEVKFLKELIEKSMGEEEMIQLNIDNIGTQLPTSHLIELSSRDILGVRIKWGSGKEQEYHYKLFNLLDEKTIEFLPSNIIKYLETIK